MGFVHKSVHSAINRFAWEVRLQPLLYVISKHLIFILSLSLPGILPVFPWLLFIRIGCVIFIAVCFEGEKRVRNYIF